MIINNNNNQKFDHFGSEIPKIFVVWLSLDAKNETNNIESRPSNNDDDDDNGDGQNHQFWIQRNIQHL